MGCIVATHRAVAATSHCHRELCGRSTDWCISNTIFSYRGNRNGNHGKEIILKRKNNSDWLFRVEKTDTTHIEKGHHYSIDAVPNFVKDGYKVTLLPANEELTEAEIKKVRNLRNRLNQCTALLIGEHVFSTRIACFCTTESKPTAIVLTVERKESDTCIITYSFTVQNLLEAKHATADTSTLLLNDSNGVERLIRTLEPSPIPLNQYN